MPFLHGFVIYHTIPYLVLLRVLHFMFHIRGHRTFYPVLAIEIILGISTGLVANFDFPVVLLGKLDLVLCTSTALESSRAPTPLTMFGPL